MLLTPRPGANLDNLLQNLQTIRDEASGLLSGSGTTAQIYVLDYLDWAGRAARMLGNQISADDLRSLVLNLRYEMLVSSFGTIGHPSREAQRVVRDLVRMEVGDRIKDLDEAIQTLKDERSRWARAGALVVPDTGFYIRHPDKLREVDFAPLLELRGSDISILVPMVVVDELDGLKQHNKEHVRWRAGYTLAVLDGLFQATSGPATLREGDFSAVTPGKGGIPRGRVSVELLFDPPGHVRLPINDDEIIDRALAVQALAGQKVRMLTYDTGQSMRARNAGLTVVKPPEDIGPEPTPAEEGSRRGRGGGRSGRSADVGAAQ